MRAFLLISVLASALAPARVEADRAKRLDGQPITIAELLAAATRRSPRIAIARADREEAALRRDAAEAIDQWRLVGRLSAQDTAADRALADSDTPLDARSATAELGVERSLFTGGELAAGITAGRVRNLYPAAARAEMTGDLVREGATAAARVQASQPLLRGAGPAVARGAQHQTRLAARALAAQSDDEAAQLVRDLVIAYCELIYTSEALAVERDGEALARRQLAITKDVVRAGLQPPSAVKRAELEVALREEAVLRQQLAIGDLSLALRRLAGLELDGPPLIPGDPLELPAIELDETSVVRAARAHGPSIAQLRLAQQAADIDVELAGNARLPRLDVVVAGSVGGVGPSLSDAFGNVGEAQTYAVMAGLVLRWDLGGAASATAAATRVRRARLDAERSDVARALAATAISATRQLGAAKRRSELTDTAVQVADEALQAELVAFQAGRSTNVAVFQRRDEAAEARLRRARARADAAEALTVVDYLTGKLLERHGLELAASRPS